MRQGILPFLMAHLRARQKAARAPEKLATDDLQRRQKAAHKMIMQAYGAASDDTEAEIPDYGDALAKALLSLQKGQRDD
jgi:hypothetical protein